MQVGEGAERRRRPGISGIDERDPDGIEVGLGVDTFAHPQSLLKEGVEGGTGPAHRLRFAQGLAQLRADLALADCHRI